MHRRLLFEQLLNCKQANNLRALFSNYSRAQNATLETQTAIAPNIQTTAKQSATKHLCQVANSTSAALRVKCSLQGQSRQSDDRSSQQDFAWNVVNSTSRQQSDAPLQQRTVFPPSWLLAQLYAQNVTGSSAESGLESHLVAHVVIAEAGEPLKAVKAIVEELRANNALAHFSTGVQFAGAKPINQDELVTGSAQSSDDGLLDKSFSFSVQNLAPGRKYKLLLFSDKNSLNNTQDFVTLDGETVTAEVDWSAQDGASRAQVQQSPNSRSWHQKSLVVRSDLIAGSSQHASNEAELESESYADSSQQATKSWRDEKLSSLAEKMQLLHKFAESALKTARNEPLKVGSVFAVLAIVIVATFACAPKRKSGRQQARAVVTSANERASADCDEDDGDDDDSDNSDGKRRTSGQPRKKRQCNGKKLKCLQKTNANASGDSLLAHSEKAQQAMVECGFEADVDALELQLNANSLLQACDASKLNAASLYANELDATQLYAPLRVRINSQQTLAQQDCGEQLEFGAQFASLDRQTMHSFGTGQMQRQQQQQQAIYMMQQQAASCSLTKAEQRQVAMLASQIADSQSANRRMLENTRARNRVAFSLEPQIVQTGNCRQNSLVSNASSHSILNSKQRNKTQAGLEADKSATDAGYLYAALPKACADESGSNNGTNTTGADSGHESPQTGDTNSSSCLLNNCAGQQFVARKSELANSNVLLLMNLSPSDASQESSILVQSYDNSSHADATCPLHAQLACARDATLTRCNNAIGSNAHCGEFAAQAAHEDASHWL